MIAQESVQMLSLADRYDMITFDFSGTNMLLLFSYIKTTPPVKTSLDLTKWKSVWMHRKIDAVFPWTAPPATAVKCFFALRLTTTF